LEDTLKPVCICILKTILRKRTLINSFAASLFILFPTWPAIAQQQSPDGAQAQAQQVQEPPGGKHVLGVVPNYRTVNESQVSGPLTNGQKFTIARKDTIDFPFFMFVGGLAGIGQWSNQHPSFGQGMKGFGRRYATTFADQAVANFMVEGFLPVVLHQDPRYYRRGTGTTWSRVGYAVSRLVVTENDSGHRQFNYSEWVGNATGTALANTYYADERTIGANVQQFGLQMGLDGLDFVMKEFWPDLKQKFFEHH
jgi:hypothetical protein